MDTTQLGSKGEVCTTSQAHVFVANFDQLIACCDFSEVARSAKRSQTGKRLPGALYVHVSALSTLERSLQDYENLARQHLKKLEGATLVKFSTDQPRVSYLSYPEFDTDAHPALQWSVLVDLVTSQVGVRNYNDTDNPPVLHRKETFVTSDSPLYHPFAELMRQEEALGLLNQSREIGTREGWAKRLIDCGIEIQGHVLACPTSRTAVISQPKIDRHKAALVRNELSKPVRVALEAGLFTPETTFFDYGCGHGEDVERIGAYPVGGTASQRGYISAGWDPYYHPSAPCRSADIVNLGYIINVIEDPAERREALLKAWELTGKVLIVAAQVCASRTIGRPEEATVVKFHTSKPKITYLFYPDFDREPHPCLRTSMQIDLQDLHVSYRDYDPEDNPPVLHQKELLVQSDYSLYEKFAKLSRQEADWGLLDDLGSVRDRRGWQKCLEEHCAELKGHRVVWRKDADPYQKKLVQSIRRLREV